MQKPVRFILIDDEMYSNKISKTFIKKMYPGVEIVDFTSPRNALDYISNEYITRPVLTAIFLDINMPEMNGWQVLKKLEALSPAIKQDLTIIMLSSSIDPKDKEKAAENALVAGYIEKPLSKEILRSLYGE